MMFAVLPPFGGAPIGGLYLGLVQTWDGSGDASGSVEFYAGTNEDGEGRQETTVFLAWDACPVTLWAHAIAEHYSSLQGHRLVSGHQKRETTVDFNREGN